MLRRGYCPNEGREVRKMIIYFFGYQKLLQRLKRFRRARIENSHFGRYISGQDEALGSHLKVQGPRSLELLALDMHMGTAT
jgi:hypothetical protein